MPRLDVAQFDVSMKTGFILENPLTKLPAYFDAWNNLSSKMSQLVASKGMRDEVKKLPVLDFNKLNGPNEVKLGHLQLAMMTSGYLWQNGLDDVPTSLPNCLAAPLYGIYEKYDIPPVMTYGDILLNNAIAKGGPQPENISAIVDIPADKKDWDWYIGVSYMAEFEFAKAVPALQNVFDGMDENNDDKIAAALKQIAEAAGNIQKTMGRFSEKLSADVLFPKMWAFFGGYGELTLHDGLIFEGVKDQPIKMKGGNASQSPTLRVLDNLLGIANQPERTAFIEEIMKYIQPNHRKFIQAVGERNLKARVDASGNAGLKEAFQGLKAALSNLRNFHVQVVTKYIVQAFEKNLPAAKQGELKPMKESAMKTVQGFRDDCK
uniref:Indoleamine dioxygenase like-myoglobin n=1 Tax=Turbo cornutus TaxID=63673 RepID=O77055_TURCO|nr:indoleamine dioxygenase like-myoglobin [Turbo cornutus]